MTNPAHNIGLVGFSRATAKIFESEGLNIVSHIYSNHKDKKKNTETAPQFMNFHSWKSYNFLQDYNQVAPLDKVASAKKNYMDEFIRCTDRWPWSSELINNWNDYNHLFKLACDHAYGWLKHHKIKCVIYSNVPHQGLALAQYAMAKELGIKTLVFMQSPFPGKCWLVEDWNDMGSFITSKTDEQFIVDISAPSAPPFYMASTKGKIKRKIRNLLQQIRARTLITFGLTGLSYEKRRNAFQRNTKRWQNAIEDSRYQKQAASFFTNQPKDERYVYFPLHLQPEMTTDILGGKYADQIFALEILREIIPDKTPIYVKENPKQTGLLRSESFFNRLKKIPDLTFISPEVSSFELIQKSIAVATITGTAGWEALRMKKPAIVFGNIFWSNLPGAFHIAKKPTWKEINNFEFNSQNLQDAANKLSNYAHTGICDVDYSVELQSFDENTNAKNLVKAINYHL